MAARPQASVKLLQLLVERQFGQTGQREHAINLASRCVPLHTLVPHSVLHTARAPASLRLFIQPVICCRVQEAEPRLAKADLEIVILPGSLPRP